MLTINILNNGSLIRVFDYLTYLIFQAILEWFHIQSDLNDEGIIATSVITKKTLHLTTF